MVRRSEEDEKKKILLICIYRFTDSVNCSVSISETKIRKLMEINEPFTAYTSKHLVKSYPKGLRQDSSNFCPIQSWIFGIQSVSLNMQTNGKNLDLNSGLFRINGNCGYVLKPPILIQSLSKLFQQIIRRIQQIYQLRNAILLRKKFSKIFQNYYNADKLDLRDILVNFI